jgi:hypothetical protein
MYPSDALTVQHELIGPTSYTLVSGTNAKTIIGLSIQQSGVASTSNLKCGTTVLALNYGKDLPYNNTSYYCSDNININKTGQDSSSFIITYVNRDTRTTMPLTASASISASLNPEVNRSINDMMYINYYFFIIVLFVLGFIIGKALYKK